MADRSSGIGRSVRVRESLARAGVLDPNVFRALCARLSYVCGDYNELATFLRLCERLGAAERPVFYTAVPPALFEEVVRALARAGCVRQGRFEGDRLVGAAREALAG